MAVVRGVDTRPHARGRPIRIGAAALTCHAEERHVVAVALVPVPVPVLVLVAGHCFVLCARYRVRT